MLNELQFYLFGQVQTSQTWSQLYSDTYPYGECSLNWSMLNFLGGVGLITKWPGSATANAVNTYHKGKDHYASVANIINILRS